MPVEKFLGDLGGKQAQKVVWVLRLVGRTGFRPSRYLKKLVGADGLEERAQHGGDLPVDRLPNGSRFVGVSGFSKKTEKIPWQEREVAEVRRQDI